MVIIYIEGYVPTNYTLHKIQDDKSGTHRLMT